jgi:S-methylmethionine-dependent homocysteine/selenocysteine methylase
MTTSITDGGLETSLIFHDGFELPHFAAFVLLDDDRGVQALRDYYAPYVEIASEHQLGALLDTPTWRASPDWGDLLGYSPERLGDVNRRAVALLREIADNDPAITVSGCVGPRGDGYRADRRMSGPEAEEYHALQIEALASAGADMVTALTLTYVDEAVGVVRAAQAAGVPVAISFTVETDGRLPSGGTLGDAIAAVDDETAGAPAYFMINCAHPTHFADALADGGAWVERIRGLRANASTKSHAELDDADELDEGDPLALAESYRDLIARLPQLTLLGGCCGTDHRHIRAICEATRI